MNDLNSVQNIDDILYIKLRELENKCTEYGYIKENSIKIISVSSGFLNPIIFVPFIEYKVLCSALIFKPNVNDIYLVDVLSINKIGIMCCIKYKHNNKTIIPIKIIISKHNQNVELLENIKIDDKIYIKIVCYKFSKNSYCIESIANLVSKDYIENIKKYKCIIDELNNIKHDCVISIDKIYKYYNILKFILDKETISYNELFIYEFILKNNITTDINIDKYTDMYNDYIINFNKKEEISTNSGKSDDIILDDDMEYDNDTNYETNPDIEDETNPDLDEDNGYAYDEDDELQESGIEIDEENNEDEDDEDDDDDDDEDDDIENDEDNSSNQATKKIHSIKKM